MKHPLSPDLLQILEEMIEQQQEVVLASARRIVPRVTRDDLLQPNDFPELELHPHFRYEEGVLHGLLSARASFLSEFLKLTKSVQQKTDS